jgi:hypothetical protein
MSFRDRLYTTRIARAMMSPAAIVATGAGASLGIVVGAGPIGAILLGAAGWLTRVALALPRRASTGLGRPEDLPEPWRAFVEDARAANNSFGDAIRSTHAGPLRDRLSEIGANLQHGVEVCHTIAFRGAAISRARRRIDVTAISRELAGIPRDGRDANVQTIAALQAQLDTAGRMDEIIRDAHDRLRLLNARMDESVARASELSVKAEDVNELEGLGDNVGDLVTQLDAMRQALDDPALNVRERQPGFTTER